MNRISVIYYSFTGNTYRMVQALEKGLIEAKADFKIQKIYEIDKENFFSGDLLVMISPANGDEEIDRNFFKDFMIENAENFNGKKVFLMGTYGWGGGVYLKKWKKQLEELGATVVADPVSCKGSPDKEMKEKLFNLGEILKNI